MQIYISQNTSTVASKPVNAMPSPSPDPWEARATPAFALLDLVPDGKAEDGSNTDPVLCVESAPSC
jgi:hypothetical protein